MPRTAPAKTPAEMREALGLSLPEAAKSMGLSPIVLERVERGGRGVTVATLDRVADFYGVSLTDLVAGCEKARAA